MAVSNPIPNKLFATAKVRNINEIFIASTEKINYIDLLRYLKVLMSYERPVFPEGTEYKWDKPEFPEGTTFVPCEPTFPWGTIIYLLTGQILPNKR